MADEEINNQEKAPEATPQNNETLTSLQGFSDVMLNCRVLLGKVKMPSSSFLKLTRGSIVELAKKKTDPLDVTVNKLKVAEAEILLQNDTIAVEIVSVYKKPKIAVLP